MEEVLQSVLGRGVTSISSLPPAAHWDPRTNCLVKSRSYIFRESVQRGKEQANPKGACGLPRRKNCAQRYCYAVRRSWEESSQRRFALEGHLDNTTSTLLLQMVRRI